MDHAFEIAELKRRLDNLIQVGRVAACDYEAARAKVAIGERVSGWLPFMTERANSQEVSWDAPEIGEHVMVLSMSGDLANGRILPAALYCLGNAAPSINPDVITRMHQDGAHDTYARDSHTRTIQIPADGALKLIVGGTEFILTQDAATLNAPVITLTAGAITLDGEVHLGGTGGEPVARKGDDISHATQKITKGSSNVYSK